MSVVAGGQTSSSSQPSSKPPTNTTQDPAFICFRGRSSSQVQVLASTNVALLHLTSHLDHVKPTPSVKFKHQSHTTSNYKIAN